MLHHAITEYTPIAFTIAQLEPEETHYYSFRATETKKQLLGYQPQPFLQYTCHLTDQRLILEPQQVSDWQDWQTHSIFPQIDSLIEIQTSTYNQSVTSLPTFYQINYAHIQKIKVIRGLTGSTVQLTLATPTEPNKIDRLVLALSTTAGSDQAGDRSADFVTLGTGLLDASRIAHPSQILPPHFSVSSVKAFRQTVMASDVPVVVNFVAPGCEPCQAFTPVIDEVLAQYSNQIKLIKVDIEKNFNIPLQYGIDCFPAVLIFKAGQVVDQVIGTVPKVILTKVLNKHLA